MKCMKKTMRVKKKVKIWYQNNLKLSLMKARLAKRILLRRVKAIKKRTVKLLKRLKMNFRRMIQTGTRQKMNLSKMKSNFHLGQDIHCKHQSLGMQVKNYLLQ